MQKWIPSLVAGTLSLLLWAQPARAQSGINQVNILTFEPTTSPYGILTADVARTQDHLGWYGGLYLGYAYDPFRAIIDNDEPIHSFVRHHVPLDLVGSMGIWKYFEVGLHMPFVLYQAPEGETDPLGMGDPAIRGSAVGDLRIVPKARFWENTDHGFGLAVVPMFTLPSGFEEDNAGEQLPTFEPKVIADYTFEQGTVIALNTGVRIRDRVEVIRLRVDDEFFYSLGADINVYNRQVSVLAELFGSVGFSDAPGDPTEALDPEEAPLELITGVRYRTPFGLIATAGGGPGITDGWSTPAFRVFVGAGFSPLPPEPDKDSDGDGLMDREDQCPEQPEDKDKHEDADGCPDPDDDKDGICDENPEIQKHLQWHEAICTGSDSCPRKAEDKDEFEDTDGCPDADNDADEVPDTKDKCRGTDADKKDGFAKTKEDRDGHDDEDGCPDPDNDKDKICDDNDTIQKSLPRWAPGCQGTDKCPDKPETMNGFEDEDGCPDKKPVVQPKILKELVISDKAHFALNQWVLTKPARDKLDGVAEYLKQNPEIQLVEIAGHADERGTDEYNDTIARNRAEAVRSYLVKKGIAADRLVVKSYGRSQPVMAGCKDLTTPEEQQDCWQKNRRVVFTVLKSTQQ